MLLSSSLDLILQKLKFWLEVLPHLLWHHPTLSILQTKERKSLFDFFQLLLFSLQISGESFILCHFALQGLLDPFSISPNIFWLMCNLFQMPSTLESTLLLSSLLHHFIQCFFLQLESIFYSFRLLSNSSLIAAPSFQTFPHLQLVLLFLDRLGPGLPLVVELILLLLPCLKW
jgi:hypothetical protein